jgi:hypothetical protein
MKNQNNARRWDNIFKATIGLILITLTVFTILLSGNGKEAQAVGIKATYISYDTPADLDLVDHVRAVGEQYDIPAEIILAIIEKESNYDANAVGDDGKSKGLMQIQERWHQDRMYRLKCTDLLDPYQNITVGADYLAELIANNEGDIEKALIAYNMGQKGAERYYFSVGLYSSEYSRKVLEIAADITEGVKTEMFFYTDDPAADYDRYSEEQDKQLQKYPQCSICDNHIQDEFLYLINDEFVCEECLKDEFRKNVEDYIE